MMDQIRHNQIQPILNGKSSNIGKCFVENILNKDKADGFDFTIEQIQYLCELEPENYEKLLDTLSLSAIKQSLSNNYAKTNHDISKINQAVENETTGHTISEKDDNGYAALSNIYVLRDNQYNFLVLPRHILIMGLIPFFPVMLLYTASGGAAFFVTTGREFLMR
jgi:hypothetical protein